MKTILQYFLKGSFLYFLLPFSLNSQNLTGIWKGYFITKDFNQYKVEFQLKQTNREISGVSYSYLTTVYYGKATMTGQFQKASSISIQETRTVEVKSTDGGINCLMNFSLMYNQSGREEYLEGTFTSQYETTGAEAKKGEDCGGGRIYLRRVKSSDFYPEPFLQNSTTKKIIINEAPARRTTDQPSNGRKGSLEPSSLAPSNFVSESESPRTTLPNAVAEETNSALLPKEPQQVPVVNNNRINDLLKVLTVTTPQLKVQLYDNGEVDGDTVSVYLNNKIVLSQKRLSATPLEFSLQLDKANNIQEITVVAENLGRIPPNSALMIVEAGTQQFRVQITSTEQKNAVVRFRYDPKNP